MRRELRFFAPYLEPEERVLAVFPCASRRTAYEQQAAPLLGGGCLPLSVGIPGIVLFGLFRQRQIFCLCLTDRRLLSVELQQWRYQPIPHSLWAASRSTVRYLGITTWINSMLHLEIGGRPHHYFVTRRNFEELRPFAELAR